ncbi:hypothetical protein [Prosthecomicrobium sp. N25]|uniref:hypothetical protein n=1 Tax=Prosthecomicrobium sp. N25 TaxID=3129254 RepID=UPI0030773F1C
MACKTLLIGWLTVFLPEGAAAPAVATRSHTDVLGIPGLIVREWSARVGGVDVRVWDGHPPYPGEPAEVLGRERIAVRGGAVEVLDRRSGTRSFAAAYPEQAGGPGRSFLSLDAPLFPEGREAIAAVLGAACTE